MGLDMYLYKETYVQNWDHHQPERRHKITIKVGDKIRRDIKPERISYITEQVAYWRKFNALHNWFVENCGGGIDECQRINVPNEKLVELVNTLKKVKDILDKSKKTTKVIKGWNDQDYEVSTYDCEDAIKDLLEPTPGFFFGSTEIDEYYKHDVDSTIEKLEEILSEEEEAKNNPLVYTGDFYYQASW